MGEPGDLLVDLHALNVHGRIEAGTLAAVGSGPHAENQKVEVLFPGVFLLHACHHGCGHCIVVVHTGEPRVLPENGLDAEEHVGGEDHTVVSFLYLEIVVNRLPLVQKIVFPEGKVGLVPKCAAQQEEDRPHNGSDTPDPGTDEVDQGQSQQDSGEDQEGDGSPHRRDGYKGRDKRPDDAAHGVGSAECHDDTGVVLQILHRVFRQRRSHRPQQEEREDEDQHAGPEGRPDQVVGVDGKDQNCGDAEDDVLSCYRDQSNPDRRNGDPAIETVGVRVFVRTPAAVDVAEGHGNHNRADDDGPNDLGRGEVRRQQTARPELHRHNRHSGKEFRQIEIIFVFENRPHGFRMMSQMRSTVSSGRSAYMGRVSTRSAVWAATGVAAGSKPSCPL